MKYVKRFIQAFVILVVLIVAAAFIAITFYKKELAGILVEYVKTQYGLSAKVEKVNISLFENWPHASIKLENATVTSTLNKFDTIPMFKAGTLAISFELSKLITKEFIVNSVALENAEINLVKDSADFSNFQVLSKKDTVIAEKSKLSFDIKKVSLKNVHLRYRNTERLQDISLLFMHNTIRLTHHSEGFKAHLQGDIHVDQLLFKPSKGPFLKNTDAELDLSLNVFTAAKSIFADRSSFAVINGQRYTLGAFVELGERKRLVLNVTADKVDFNKSAVLLNTNIRHALSQVSLDHTVSIDALVVASIGKAQDPMLIVKISGEHDNITIGNSKIPYNDVSFEGQIICVPDSAGKEPDMEKARIVFNKIRGKVYEFPFSASLLISNLKTPVIAITADLQIDAAKVKFKPGQDLILAGNCQAQVSYSGPISGLGKETFLNDPMKLNASLSFRQFSYRENFYSMLYTINGQATVNNHDLKFSNLSVKNACGMLMLAGVSSGFTPYALGNTNGFKTTLKASTDLYDLNPLLTVNPQKLADASNNKQPKTAKPGQSNFAFDISLLAKKVLIRKVVATNVSAELKYERDLLSVQSLNMSACNGVLSAKGTLNKMSDIKARVIVSNMNIETMMEQFENFGQKAIESRNLKGTVSVDANIDTRLDDKMEIMPQTMLGQMDVKLKNGHVVNYEPIQRLSNFVFKNRDFDDVSFTEFNQTFKLKGYEMEINNMEIASNIINLYLNGYYNFKAESNINILIPWSNLKKRGENYVPKNLGKDGQDAKGLKLNYHGFPDKLKLSLGNK